MGLVLAGLSAEALADVFFAGVALGARTMAGLAVVVGGMLAGACMERPASRGVLRGALFSFGAGAARVHGTALWPLAFALGPFFVGRSTGGVASRVGVGAIWALGLALSLPTCVASPPGPSELASHEDHVALPALVLERVWVSAVPGGVELRVADGGGVGFVATPAPAAGVLVDDADAVSARVHLFDRRGNVIGAVRVSADGVRLDDRSGHRLLRFYGVPVAP